MISREHENLHAFSLCATPNVDFITHQPRHLMDHISSLSVRLTSFCLFFVCSTEEIDCEIKAKHHVQLAS